MSQKISKYSSNCQKRNFFILCFLAWMRRYLAPLPHSTSPCKSLASFSSTLHRKPNGNNGEFSDSLCLRSIFGTDTIKLCQLTQKVNTVPTKVPPLPAMYTLTISIHTNFRTPPTVTTRNIPTPLISALLLNINAISFSTKCILYSYY